MITPILGILMYNFTPILQSVLSQEFVWFSQYSSPAQNLILIRVGAKPSLEIPLLTKGMDIKDFVDKVILR